ncbi:MAG: DNA gyrase inhibitor YacG [Planctomycetes bacterium]|nr:DNA gyrase inhibitor YacG [Planctomycetota bacterium]
MSKIKCRYCEKIFVYNFISEIPTFPFCSERCQLMDLGLWLSEEHGIDKPVGNDTSEGEQSFL